MMSLNPDLEPDLTVPLSSSNYAFYSKKEIEVVSRAQSLSPENHMTGLCACDVMSTRHLSSCASGLKLQKSVRGTFFNFVFVMASVLV